MSSDPNKKIKLLFSCLDWRLHPQIEEFFVKEGDGCDCCVTAGSVKGFSDETTRNFLLEQISISLTLHNCQSVILTMHMDCGAYGGSGVFGDEPQEYNHHAKVLRDAQSIVANRFPELNIEKYIIGLKKTGEGWTIDPKKVD
jgi:carbonic anhydrase